ncbi:MAG: glycoside hydrolase family 28 protein, partial [Paludibacteraceae bacterium]
RNIYVKNIVSRNARRAMFFNGLPEMKISNIHVENVFISSIYGAELSNSKDVDFKNVYIEAKVGSALILNNVDNFKSENLTYPKDMDKPIDLKERGNSNILISGVKLK